MSVLAALPTGLHRGFGYFAVLRPSCVFGVIVGYLPLTALEFMPGNSMLGNLFV